MWKRHFSLFVIAGITVAAVLVVYRFYTDEPRYLGRPLSSWVALQQSKPGHTPDRYDAGHAIREIGTNGLPFLLRWIEAEPEPWRARVAAPIRTLGGWRLAAWMETSRREARANNAFRAFCELARVDKAAPAIPELIRMMNDPTKPATSRRVTVLLGCLGTNALPGLISALENPRHHDHATVFHSLGQMRPPPEAAAAVVPLLIRWLQDANDVAQAAGAAEMLGCLKAAPGLSVPALTACVQSGRPDLGPIAARALGEFHTNAISAVPALIAALTDPDPRLQRSAGIALMMIIAPLSLTNHAPACSVPGSQVGEQVRQQIPTGR